jgi:hypothetical protein
LKPWKITSRLAIRESARAIGGAATFTQDKLNISEEIRRVIAEAAEAGSSVHAHESALSIAKAYPNCRLTASQISDRITQAALAAQLPLTLSKRSFSTAVFGRGASKLPVN